MLKDLRTEWLKNKAIASFSLKWRELNSHNEVELVNSIDPTLVSVVMLDD